MNMNIAGLVAYAMDMTSATPGGVLKSSARAVPFTAGGSKRYFLRLSDGDRSVVALIEPDNRQELERYYTIGSFLRENGIGVPRIYNFDRKRGVLIMEDLGDCTLEKMWIRGNGITYFYKLCLDQLCHLQVFVTGKIDEEGSPSLDLFGRDQFLEETDYFEREFMSRFEPEITPGEWESEREKLADTLAGEEPVFMHRDFQSRNIIITANQPRFIDFQTSHLGPRFYDAASLLRDPYVSLPEETVDSLLKYYYESLDETGAHAGYSFEDFARIFNTAGIQRNLQALAAYARLGFGDGKPEFLRSIRPALFLLEKGAKNIGSYPAIQKMAAAYIDRIRESELRTGI